MTASRPANKRELQAAATREQLLKAARDSFSEDGFKATTVGSITTRAGCAHGTFYLYFKNKDDAFGQVIAEAIDALVSQATGRWSPDPTEGIAEVMRGFLGVFDDHRELWRALLEGMLLSEEIERTWLRLRGAFVDRIARSFARERERGRLRATDPDRAAYALVAMVEWYGFTHLVLDVPERVGDDDVARSGEVLADLWLRAVYGRLPGEAG